MPLAKITLHVYFRDQGPEHHDLDVLSKKLADYSSDAGGVGKVDVTHAEWITDWDEETADDVPLDKEHPFGSPYPGVPPGAVEREHPVGWTNEDQ